MGQEAPKGLGQRARLAATEVGLGAHNPKGREVPEVTGVEVGQKVLGEVGQGHTVRLKVMPREVQEGNYMNCKMTKLVNAICDNKNSDQHAHLQSDQCLRHCLNGIILIVAVPRMLRLYLASAFEQTG